MNERYIVERGVPGSVPGCNTVEDLQLYLSKIPFPDHRLVNVQLTNGNFVMIWENLGIQTSQSTVADGAVSIDVEDVTEDDPNGHIKSDTPFA